MRLAGRGQGVPTTCYDQHMPPKPAARAPARRATLYQLCRADDVFAVGDGPVPLTSRGVVLGAADADGGAHADVVVDDPSMSARHAQVVPLDKPRPDGGAAPTRFVVEDLGSERGVVVNGVPTRRSPLLPGDVLETGRTFWTVTEEAGDDPILEEPYELGGIATWTPAYARQLMDVDAWSATAGPILVSGAPGVGKGFLARTIHSVSGRVGRLVHLDCRDRKERRLVADLFGDGRKQGRVADAEGGTLFLEGFEAVSPAVQDRLLDHVKRRSGARLVLVLSDREDALRAAGLLRPELVAACHGRHVRVPSLHERFADMGLLLDEFLARARGAPAIAPDVVRCLLRASLPQHVRTLGRVVEAAAALAGVVDPRPPEPDTGGRGHMRGTVLIQHLPLELVGRDRALAYLAQVDSSLVDGRPELTRSLEPHPEPAQHAPFGAPDLEATDPMRQRSIPSSSRGQQPSVPTVPRPSTPRPGETIDAERILSALRDAHGNVSAAANALRRPRAQLVRWMREFGIDLDTLRRPGS